MTSFHISNLFLVCRSFLLFTPTSLLSISLTQSLLLTFLPFFFHSLSSWWFALLCSSQTLFPRFSSLLCPAPFCLFSLHNSTFKACSSLHFLYFSFLFLCLFKDFTYISLTFLSFPFSFSLSLSKDSKEIELSAPRWDEMRWEGKDKEWETKKKRVGPLFVRQYPHFLLSMC